jgi:8-oxo-dGTP diphosphatase
VNPEAAGRSGAPGKPPFRTKVLKPPRFVPGRPRVVTHPPIDVVAGVIRREGRLLITQRLPDDTLAGYWEFPGGKVEANEELVTALRRELLEELGVNVAIGAELHRVVHTYPDRDVRLYFYEAEIIAGEPRPLEASDLRWVKPEELMDYQFPEADLPLLDLLRRGGNERSGGA